MSRKQVLKAFKQELHISHNQIFTYLNCSLKYRFQYIEGRLMERISIALPFGSAIHSAMELFYRTLKKSGEYEELNAVIERFEICLELDLDNTSVPVIYKKGTPDRKATIEMGSAMLGAFYENTTVEPDQIVDVELPLSARLYTDEGKPTEFMLVGILDLLLMDENSETLVVDNKTAVQPLSQKAADENLQMSAYAYLLAANKYVFPTAPVKCRFDVLRKLKTPKLEIVQTVRTAQDRKRFAKIANAVLSGIDAGVYMPQPSWMCSDCAYSKRCREW